MHRTFHSSCVFSPEAVAAISRAYSAALDMFDDERQRDVRDKLAEHMMFLARHGEFDEQRLCTISVLAVVGQMPGPECPDGATARP